jgi:hypothetical protein
MGSPSGARIFAQPLIAAKDDASVVSARSSHQGEEITRGREDDWRDGLAATRQELRKEMHQGDEALRQEIRATTAETIHVLRDEIRAGDAETRTLMDLVARISLSIVFTPYPV